MDEENEKTQYSQSKLKKSEICIYDDCKTRCSYNFEGNKRGIYCNKHKLKGILKKKIIKSKCNKKTMSIILCPFSYNYLLVYSLCFIHFLSI
jgi:hypothetical protein